MLPGADARVITGAGPSPVEQWFAPGAWKYRNHDCKFAKSAVPLPL